MSYMLNKVVQCADGFAMSVQASQFSYSNPRADDADEYTHAEVGMPNKEEDLLTPYAEDHETPTTTVYPYVPRQLIINVIAKHGGMIGGDLPAGFPYLYAPGAKKHPS